MAALPDWRPSPYPRDTGRAMSQQNVEVVRRLVALWEGDAEIAYMRDDAAWARYKPRIEPLFEPGCTFAWVGGGIESEYSGLDGFREGWLDIYGALESARNQFEQIVPVRDKVPCCLVCTPGSPGPSTTSRRAPLPSSSCETAGSGAPSSMRTAPTPSKPWGCGTGLRRKRTRGSRETTRETPSFCRPNRSRLVGLALRPSTPAPREQRQPKREQRADATDSEAHGIPAGPVFRFRSVLRRAVWLAPWRARPSKPWGCGSSRQAVPSALDKSQIPVVPAPWAAVVLIPTDRNEGLG